MFQGFRNPPSRAKEPHPLLFLTVILSQQECNGLLIPVNVRILDQPFSLEPIWNPPPRNPGYAPLDLITRTTASTRFPQY